MHILFFLLKHVVLKNISPPLTKIINRKYIPISVFRPNNKRIFINDMNRHNYSQV